MIFRNIIFAITLLSLIMLSMACTSTPKEIDVQKETPLLGSWEMISVFWITKDTTYSIEKAQPGLLMITPNRYSIMWTPIEEPRNPFKNLSGPTNEEILDGFRSIVFNAGTYEVTDSTLTTEAIIAKVPGFERGKQYYKYRLNDDKLELTMFDETYPDGKKPKWFGKEVTKFVLRKVE